MSPEDKQRIEKEAVLLFADNGPLVRGYIAGATRENERMAELLKEERNKVIDECRAEMKRFCIALYNNGLTATPEEISRSLESLKSTVA